MVGSRNQMLHSYPHPDSLPEGEEADGTAVGLTPIYSGHVDDERRRNLEQQSVKPEPTT